MFSAPNVFLTYCEYFVWHYVCIFKVETHVFIRSQKFFFISKFYALKASQYVFCSIIFILIVFCLRVRNQPDVLTKERDSFW